MSSFHWHGLGKAWTTLSLTCIVRLPAHPQLPQFFQVVKGVSALRSGVLLLPLILVQTVTCVYWREIVSRHTVFADPECASADLSRPV
jgi:hypothetical protein